KHGNLKVFPIFSSGAGNNGYTLLQDALKSKKFLVTEVDESGNVPNLKVVNHLEEDVLILDGEALVGAKQNRIVNTTIIIGKKKEIVIPVSCVEEGRWGYTRRNFTAGRSNLYANLRKKKAKSVTKNLKVSQSYRSDQGEIWDDISDKAERLSVNSGTHNMHDIYNSYEDKLKKYEKIFSPKPGQAGFIAMINGRVVGFDIFGTGNILPKVYQSLLRGYILDALDMDMTGTKTPLKKKTDLKKKAETFLEGLRTAKRSAFKSVGEGDDLRLEGNSANGFALVHNNKIVHLAAFAE
ncbi:MAG: TIGR02452 family protein, partial [Candidatus Mariimomonas ferrooxydans]